MNIHRAFLVKTLNELLRLSRAEVENRETQEKMDSSLKGKAGYTEGTQTLAHGNELLQAIESGQNIE